jgi:hypothetical protein
MKTAIKHSLSRLGLFPYLDLLRRLPGIIRWLRSGCRGLAPPPVKRMVLTGYLRSNRLKHFIETGTHLGDTLADVAYDQSLSATSIELDEAYFNAAKQRFANYSNVTLLQGDSGIVMPAIVQQLKEPALFWLDGHFSGGKTSKGELETPISAELEAILKSPIAGHVILIDDARCFDGTHDYPHLDQLLETVRHMGRYHIEVSTDIIRMTPINIAAL